MIRLFSTIAFLSILGVNSLAQFTIKLPKIPKVDKKAEQQKTDVNQTPTDPTNSRTRTGSNPTSQKSGKPYPAVEWPDRPEMIWDRLYIQAENRNKWKVSSQKQTIWVPKIRFKMDYDRDKFSLEYLVEYFKPDGSLWFGEELRNSGGGAENEIAFESDSATTSAVLDTKPNIAVGTYGFKITEKNTKETLFQGKFKVGKFAAGSEKNVDEFFVDHDWVMPIGYISFHYSEFNGINDLGGFPLEFNIWFKKDLDSRNHGMEARLFYKDKQIGNTADYHSSLVSDETRASGNGHVYSPELHNWELWKMTWQNVIIDNNGTYNNEKRSKSFLVDKNPGEYTVKVFQKNVQIREAKFTVGTDGRIVDRYSKPVYLTYHKVIVPVTVIGPSEIYNSNAWKTEAFYGNPVPAFAVP